MRTLWGFFVAPTWLVIKCELRFIFVTYCRTNCGYAVKRDIPILSPPKFRLSGCFRFCNQSNTSPPPCVPLCYAVGRRFHWCHILLTKWFVFKYSLFAEVTLGASQWESAKNKMFYPGATWTHTSEACGLPRVHSGPEYFWKTSVDLRDVLRRKWECL